MAGIEYLVDSYISFIKENIFIEKIENNIYEIETPFLDRRNDIISIYAIISETHETIRLTDNSYTVNDLSMSGLDFNTPKRKQELKLVLNGLGVRYDDEKKELYVETTADNFAQKKHSLIQAILSINDMFVLAQNKVRSLFFEDVELYLDKHDIRYTSNISIEGKSHLSHKFEFLIPKSKKAPERTIKLLNKPKSENLKAILFSFDDTNEQREGKGYIVLNDEENIKPEIIEAINTYSVTPIIWSNRDNYIGELVA